MIHLKKKSDHLPLTTPIYRFKFSLNFQSILFQQIPNQINFQNHSD